MKKFYLVGTPIGNFNDITIRALETLKNVDIIACEDTRTTQKLLNHFQIKNKKLIAYHNFNEKQACKTILELLKTNSVALVSDAGMPTIADPGFDIVEEVVKKQIPFELIPGVSALTSAMAISSLGPEFSFLGFGKQKKQQLINQIKSLIPGTYLFFVAPHKIEFFLQQINLWCLNHKVFIAREMTKIYESYYFGTAKQVWEELKDNCKGEITLILKIDKTKKEKINKYKKN